MVEEDKKTFLEKLSLEDKLAAGIILAVGVFLFVLVSGFQHIPSPIYGGDFYMARGFTQAILNGRHKGIVIYALIQYIMKGLTREVRGMFDYAFFTRENDIKVRKKIWETFGGVCARFEEMRCIRMTQGMHGGRFLHATLA